MNSLLKKPSALKTIKKNNPQIKEASTLAINSLYYQQIGDFEKSKNLMNQGIEKLRQVVVKDTSVDKEKVITYFSLFEKFLNNISSQQENERNENEKSLNLLFDYTKNNNNENLKDIIDLYISLNNITNTEKLFELTIKICTYLGKAIDSGFYFSKAIFLRREIFLQENAKIEQINHKHETHKTINEKLNDLNILVSKNVIKYENLNDFCAYINEVQNNLNKQIQGVNPSKYKYDNKQVNSTFVLFKTFNEISDKLKRNIYTNKLNSLPDYFSTLSKLCKNFKDFELILDYKLYKNDTARVLQKKKEICDFFYHTIILWTLNDIKSITSRFLKKKIMNFEEYYEFN